MILGFGGSLGSGKSAAAEYLHDQYGFHRMAFAGNLKAICSHVFNIDMKYFLDPNLKNTKMPSPIKFDAQHANQILDWVHNRNKWEFHNSHIEKMEGLVKIGQTFDTYRFVLQYIGTEVMRDVFHDAIHALIVFQKIERNNWDNVVIDDARFFNERKMIKDRMGVNALIFDPNEEKKEGKSHESESQLGKHEDYDFVIANDKTKGKEPLFSDMDQMMCIIDRMKSS